MKTTPYMIKIDDAKILTDFSNCDGLFDDSAYKEIEVEINGKKYNFNLVGTSYDAEMEEVLLREYEGNPDYNLRIFLNCSDEVIVYSEDLSNFESE